MNEARAQRSEKGLMTSFDQLHTLLNIMFVTFEDTNDPINGDMIAKLEKMQKKVEEVLQGSNFAK